MKKRYASYVMLGVAWVVAVCVALLVSYLCLMFWSLLCIDFDGNVTRPCGSWPVTVDRFVLILMVAAVWSVVAYLTYVIVKRWKRK